MRYPAAETARKHIRIIEESARLFQKKGFNGAGVAEIMKAAGLTHGGFYSHFNSKSDLVAASLAYVMQKTQNKVLESIEETDTPAAAKRKFLGSYLSKRHQENQEAGCALPALCADVMREPNLRTIFTVHINNLFNTLRMRFSWKKSKVDQEQQTLAFVSAIVGALMLSRAVDDEELSAKILLSVRHMLEDAEECR